MEVATSIFTDSVAEFVLLRKIFVGKVTKELLSLMDVSLYFSSLKYIDLVKNTVIPRLTTLMYSFVRLLRNETRK